VIRIDPKALGVSRCHRSQPNGIVSTMRRVITAFLVLIMIGSVAPLSAHEQPSELAEWKTEIAAAAARARAWREELKADFLRRKVERSLNSPVSDEAELARRASDQVRNDFSLRKGDIVSTTDGIFVFVGKDEGERTPADFVPLQLMQNPQEQRQTQQNQPLRERDQLQPRRLPGVSDRND
jgi:hypothetical protein